MTSIQSFIGLLIFLLFISIVIGRNISLKRQGINAVEFGKKDKKDFIILPFALLYIYLMVAHTFDLPTFKNIILFYNSSISWIGILFVIIALAFFIWTMISFRKSFRVGLVDNAQQGLITNGSFAISRNPIYVSFTFLLIGEFLVFGNWIFLVYILIGIWTFNRQVLKEEKFLLAQYGEDFTNYCKKVRRYL